MNIRIYQSYYDRKQARHLDPAFVSFDNTQNFLPELREYPILQSVRHRCVLDHVDLFGMFSWKFNEKMCGMTGETVIKHIENNPGSDAYFFNPFGHDVPYAYNIWEHGDWCHANLITVLEWLFPEIGLDTQHIYEPMNPNHFTWCNFIVANVSFWDRWLTLVNNYCQAIVNMPEHIRVLHGSSGYGIAHLDMFPFIVERLASAVAHANPDLKIWTYHSGRIGNIPQELAELQTNAIVTNDPENWQKWLESREGQLGQHRQVYPNVTNLAQKWMDVVKTQQPILFD